MLPYNYTLAYKQSSKGEPLVAPLYYHYPKDTTAVNVNDEFMWGENILVAPVLEKGMKERKVYLPEGKWYGLLDTTESEGGKWVTETVGLKRAPVYVREGSFIPYWIDRNWNGGYWYISTGEYSKKQSAALIYYPSSKPSSGILYSDDGLEKNPKGEIITFEGITINNKVVINITTNNKSLYTKGFKKRISLLLPTDMMIIPLVSDTPFDAKINGKSLPEEKLPVTQSPFNQANYNFYNFQFDGERIEFTATLRKRKLE